MRLVLYLVAVVVVWRIAMMPRHGVASQSVVVQAASVLAVALGAYVLFGRRADREHARGAGMLLGQALAYLLGALLLLPGAGLTATGAYLLLYHLLRPGEWDEFSGVSVFALSYGVLYAATGLTVLLAAGWMGAGLPGAEPQREEGRGESEAVRAGTLLRPAGAVLLLLGAALVALHGVSVSFLVPPWMRLAVPAAMAGLPAGVPLGTGMVLIAAGAWAQRAPAQAIHTAAGKAIALVAAGAVSAVAGWGVYRAVSPPPPPAVAAFRAGLTYQLLLDLRALGSAEQQRIRDARISAHLKVGDFLPQDVASLEPGEEVVVKRQVVRMVEDLIGEMKDLSSRAELASISGYRSPAEDRRLGGSGYGPHVRGDAVDVVFSIPDVLSLDVARAVAAAAYDRSVGFGGGVAIQRAEDGSSYAVHLDAVRNDSWFQEQSWAQDSQSGKWVVSYVGNNLEEWKRAATRIAERGGAVREQAADELAGTYAICRPNTRTPSDQTASIKRGSMGRYDVYLYSPWGSRDLLCIPVIPGRGAYVGPTFTATRWGQFAEAPGERKRLAMHRYEFELKDGDLVGRSSHITLDVNGKQQRRVSYDEFWPRIEPWRPDSPSWLKGIPLSYRNGDWYWGSATLQRPRGVPGFTLTAPKGPGRRDVVVNGEVFVMPADWNSLRFHEWLAKESHGFAIDARLFDRPAPWEGAPGYDEGGTGLHIDDRYFGIMAYQASRATTGKVSAQLYGKYEWMVHGDGLVAVGSVPAGGRRVRWGVVRRTGEQVTPVQYDAIKILPGGLAAVGTIATGTADISYRLIDASGAQLSPGSWDLVEPLPEGNIALARLPSGGRDATWSVMAPNGEVLEEGLDTRQVARRRCRR